MPRQTPRRARAVALLAAVLAVGACDDQPAAPLPPADLEIVARNTRWTAAAYEVTTTNGQATIRLANQDSMLHNLYVVDANGVEAATHVEAGPGTSKQAAFTLTPGTYRVICKIPGHEQMLATLTVR